MNNGSIRYSNNNITIFDSDFNEVKRVPFVKKREDDWWLYKDPRGVSVIISPLGEKGVLTFFDYSARISKFQIAFNLTD
jgi:hypothetical protein